MALLLLGLFGRAGAAAGSESECAEALVALDGASGMPASAHGAAAVLGACADAGCRASSARLDRSCGAIKRVMERHAPLPPAAGAPFAKIARALKAGLPPSATPRRGLAAAATGAAANCCSFDSCQTCSNTTYCDTGAMECGFCGASAQWCSGGCDRVYCEAACITFVHCLGATADATCNSMPADCPTRCGSCFASGNNPVVPGYIQKSLDMQAAYEAKPECHPMAMWNASRALAYMDAQAAKRLPSDDARNVSALFHAQGLDGFALAHLDLAGLRAMGLPLKYHEHVLKFISEERIKVKMSLPPAADPCSTQFGGMQRVWSDFALSRLTNVDESLYEFTVVFWWQETWLEDRHIFLPPMSAGEALACKTRIPNAHGEPGNKCADGFWGSDGENGPTYARGRIEVNLGGTSDVLATFPATYYGPMIYMPHVAWQQSLVRASFNVDMDFDDFPFDTQRLAMRSVYADLGFDMKYFRAEAGGATGSADGTGGSSPAPGWTIKSVGMSGSRLHMNSTYSDAEHPMNTGADGSMDMSQLVVSIVVERQSQFYMMNLVLPIVLLNVLSWSSFFLSPSTIDVRLATTMTILIALVAFQFIVNDSLPKTGKMTRMHQFITVSNLLIVLGGLESLLVYWLVEQDIASVDAAGSVALRYARQLVPCSRRQDRQVAEHSVAPAAGPAPGAAEQPGHPIVVRRNNMVEDFGAKAEEVTVEGPNVDQTSTAGVRQGDGVVTKQELDNIHRIDRVCAVIFPLAFSISTGVLLKRPDSAPLQGFS
eukprot:g2170.t1